MGKISARGTVLYALPIFGLHQELSPVHNGDIEYISKKDEGFELIFHIKGDAKGKDLFPSK